MRKNTCFDHGTSAPLDQLNRRPWTAAVDELLRSWATCSSPFMAVWQHVNSQWLYHVAMKSS